MARHKRSRPFSEAKPPHPSAPSRESSLLSRPISRRRKWIVRLLLVFGVPLAFLAVCEGALRLVGYGHPTEFLLATTLNGSPVWAPNQLFGRRFFGADYERKPVPFAAPRPKADERVRVFVFGESAAFGDPQPEFGLPRMLQAVLSHRYPDTRFEVINAAMTGINSHVVREIARDCGKAEGDVWVVYMGNNEVIGPFGAGTVFGPQAPPIGLVRSNLAIRTMRFGQLLGSVTESLNAPPASKRTWGGLLMFLNNQVRHDDSRMTVAYKHFERNLRDILAAAKGSRAAVVLSTVAVNLKDCAPFASLHREHLDEAQLGSWKSAFRQGRAARMKGDNAQAIDHFRAAEDIDDEYAELSFELANALLEEGDEEQAARYYAAARDKDVLRFRCDGPTNDLIRRIAADGPPSQVRLADAERTFAEASPARSPGSTLFYEHVHLTFEGNYLLARTLAEQIEHMLPTHVDRAAAADWPTLEQCGARLAWNDWARLIAVNEIIGRLADQPFTNQSNHAFQVGRLTELANKLDPLAQMALRNVDALFEVAVAAAPEDAALYAQRGSMRRFSGNKPGAIDDARRATELLPFNASHWMALGAAMATDRQFEEAAEAFKEAFQQDGQNVTALQKLARVYVQLNRPGDAIAACRRAIEIEPRFGPAYLELGRLLEQSGKVTEAERSFRAAIENRVWRVADLRELAEFCEARGWTEEAADSFDIAASLDPGDVTLRIKAGQLLVAAKRYDKARRHFADAVRLAPEMGEAHYLLGVELGRIKERKQAAEEFREAVRLMPGLVEARINLALALNNDGQRADALRQFQLVLKQDPENPIAIEYIQSLTRGAR
jgi:tetratricopeptide (TPR) repeat protein